MSDERIALLIAGGSVVGLSTALFAAHHGVPCIMVERHPTTSIHPRAVGYYPRTVELLRFAGVDSTLQREAAGFATHRTRAGVISLNGKELFSRTELEGEDELADLTPCRMVLLPQDRLEPLLRARAEQLGADLRFGVELESFEQDPDGVSAVLRDRETGSTSAVRAEYLVGADGPRSLVRTSLGLDRQGRGVLSEHVSIAFEADLAAVLRGRRFSVVHVRNDDVTGILVHDDTLTRATFVVQRAADEPLGSFTDERCTALVRAAVGDPAMDLRVTSCFPWEMAELVAERFSVGRVFLAGDAAHVIPPTGGYGANTGIADAHNLAWKIAEVVAGRAGPGLLDSYEAERLPVGRYVADQGALQLAVRGGTATPQEQAAAADPLTVTMGARYRSAAVPGAAAGRADPPAVDPRTLGGEPGGRAPHVRIGGDGAAVSTTDLFGRGFVLLAGRLGDEWVAAARSAADGFGIAVHAVLVEGPDTAWAASYGVGDRGAVMVRPDGVVAWRSVGPPRGVTHTEMLVDVVGSVLDRPSVIVGAVR